MRESDSHLRQLVLKCALITFRGGVGCVAMAHACRPWPAIVYLRGDWSEGMITDGLRVRVRVSQ